MHKMILACSSDVDHADTNGLNNQRLNLRPASESQNQANARKMAATSSTFKGVDWNKETRKWRARVNVRGKRINIGYFKDEVDAATAYNFAAFEHFCEYALLNAPRPN